MPDKISVFAAGIAVGFVLVVFGVLTISLALIPFTVALLILCCGLGIILGCFGATATVKFKGVVIAGSAAITIVLAMFVHERMVSEYVELEIGGDVREAKVEIFDGDLSILGAERRKAHRFIVMDEIRRDHIIVEIKPLGAAQPLEFNCIEKKEVNDHFGMGKIVQWRFDQAKSRILAGNPPLKIGELGSCRVANNETSTGRETAQSGLIGSAFAAEASTQQLLKDLESRSTFVRRSARDGLGKSGVTDLSVILNHWRANQDSYRVRLGVLVALSKMLSENKSLNKEISQQLSDGDIRGIVSDLSNTEPTIRVYASEFLFDLADPRAAPLIIDELSRANEKIAKDLVHALEGSYNFLPQSERDAVNVGLSEIQSTVTPKIQELSSGILEQKSVREQKFWVVVGSYANKNSAVAQADSINKEDPSKRAFVGKRKPDNKFYPVVFGDYVLRDEAVSLVESANKFTAVREHGSAPYLSEYADRR